MSCRPLCSCRKLATLRLKPVARYQRSAGASLGMKLIGRLKSTAQVRGRKGE